MFNFKFELLQLQGAIKKQQLEIEKLQNDMQKLLNSKVKVSKLVKEQQKEFDKLQKANEKLRDILYQKAKKKELKAKKKELSCMQEVEFTDYNIAKVREMAVCMTKEQIARCFNMSLTTYVKREQEIPELKKAYECGKHEFMAEATGKLVDHIRNNDVKSLFFYMNTVMKLSKENNNNETQITIAQDFLTQPLKIVGNGNYEDEISNKYAKIMSITVKNNNIDDENSET